MVFLAKRGAPANSVGIAVTEVPSGTAGEGLAAEWPPRVAPVSMPAIAGVSLLAGPVGGSVMVHGEAATLLIEKRITRVPTAQAELRITAGRAPVIGRRRVGQRSIQQTMAACIASMSSGGSVVADWPLSRSTLPIGMSLHLPTDIEGAGQTSTQNEIEAEKTVDGIPRIEAGNSGKVCFI